MRWRSVDGAEGGRAERHQHRRERRQANRGAVLQRRVGKHRQRLAGIAGRRAQQDVVRALREGQRPRCAPLVAGCLVRLVDDRGVVGAGLHGIDAVEVELLGAPRDRGLVLAAHRGEVVFHRQARVRRVTLERVDDGELRVLASRRRREGERLEADHRRALALLEHEQEYSVGDRQVAHLEGAMHLRVANVEVQAVLFLHMARDVLALLEGNGALGLAAAEDILAVQ
mmetsp:Transcript_108679/g.313853  ORF Transcript_108679/g.313853 Transcript_108679/m.313853 type:complete len:227 (-) Transcript_108679:276-956(-)